jgi:predicted nucleotidyltransferase
MNRSETLDILRSCSDEAKLLGATRLYLYGSAARDQLRPESDIDVFVDYDVEGPFSFIELVRLQDLLAERLAREVDVTTRGGLHPLLKDEIERASIRVF